MVKQLLVSTICLLLLLLMMLVVVVAIAVVIMVVADVAVVGRALELWVRDDQQLIVHMGLYNNE